MRPVVMEVLMPMIDLVDLPRADYDAREGKYQAENAADQFFHSDFPLLCSTSQDDAGCHPQKIYDVTALL